MQRLKARMELATAVFFAAIFMVAMICACASAADRGRAEEPTISTNPHNVLTETQCTVYIQPTPTTAPEPTATEPEILYDIPLTDELQRFVREQCEARGVPFEIALALIERESSYRTNVKSATNDYGLMQINACNHEWLAEELGLTDMLDPYQNITAGVYILGQAFEKYGDPNQALMAYNMGDAGMREAWEQGIRSTKYSRAVIEAANLLKER